MMRTEEQKASHARAERKRYRTLKRGLVKAIAGHLCLIVPRCTMPVTPSVLCGRGGALEIDHKRFSAFRQRDMNSVQRLERFAVEFVKWVGGDKRFELRLACRGCNARHQPKKRH